MGATASLNPLRDSRNFPLPSSENANPLAETARTIPAITMILFIPNLRSLSNVQPGRWSRADAPCLLDDASRSVGATNVSGKPVGRCNGNTICRTQKSGGKLQGE